MIALDELLLKICILLRFDEYLGRTEVNLGTFRSLRSDQVLGVWYRTPLL